MKEIIHGHARKGAATTTYNSWSQMHRRCKGYSPIHKLRYMDRGIAVCPQWSKFSNFLKDMGERPKGKTLDRIDNDKGYSPSNCRWASREEQMRNKADNVNITHNGITLCQAEWARRLGLNRVTIEKRLEKGWPIALALSPKMFHELKGRRSKKNKEAA